METLNEKPSELSFDEIKPVFDKLYCYKTKTCPFCGGDKVHISRGFKINERYRIEIACDNSTSVEDFCGVLIRSHWAKTLNDAVKMAVILWNRREGIPSITEDLEKLAV